MKKSMKAVLSFAAIALLAGVVGCGGTSGEECPVCKECPGTTTDNVSDSGVKLSGKATNGGKVLNIWAWNYEFQSRFRSFYTKYVRTNADGSDTLSDGTTVKWTIHANDNNGYQIPLDEALKQQDSAAADDKIDLFLTEADYILKYTASPYSLDVKNDIGLSEADLGEQYDYTKQIAESDGVLKGVSWQATPGLYAYRRDLAKKVFGFDDPDKVQAELSNWDKFNASAAKAKNAGYKMLSGYDDAYRVFSNNMDKPWVDANGKVSIDPQIKKWVDQTKTYVDSGYSGKTTLWSGDWGSDQGPKGNVLGFFYSTWGINFTLAGNSCADSSKPQVPGNGLYGQYAVCEGPNAWYWGGTWMNACKGTDNQQQIYEIMRDLTGTRTIDESITRITQDYTNHKTAMHGIATDATYGSTFLGGQNHIALFEKSADKINMKNMTAYDQGCNEKFQNAMHDYFAGTSTYVEALANFKQTLSAVYTDLSYDF